MTSEPFMARDDWDIPNARPPRRQSRKGPALRGGQDRTAADMERGCRDWSIAILVFAAIFVVAAAWSKACHSSALVAEEAKP